MRFTKQTTVYMQLFIQSKLFDLRSTMRLRGIVVPLQYLLGQEHDPLLAHGLKHQIKLATHITQTK